MRWTTKAKIQRVCARMPGGNRIYRSIQKRFGGLDGNPSKRVAIAVSLLGRLDEIGFVIDGARCLEVGTGGVPTVPVILLLAGASEVVSVDLHRQIDWSLTSAMLRALGESHIQLTGSLHDVGSRERWLSRQRELKTIAADPRDGLESLGLRYIAPTDASDLHWEPDESFDFHFSVAVLEHVAPADLAPIMVEAHRLLRPNGLAAHEIDPGDHFAHRDDSITAINFLRYTDAEWLRLAGNRFGYCNRLRASQFDHVFEDAGFRTRMRQGVVDARSMEALRQDFPLACDFRSFSAEDLCTISLSIYASKAERSVSRSVEEPTFV